VAPWTTKNEGPRAWYVGRTNETERNIGKNVWINESTTCRKIDWQFGVGVDVTDARRKELHIVSELECRSRSIIKKITPSVLRMLKAKRELAGQVERGQGQLCRKKIIASPP